MSICGFDSDQNDLVSDMFILFMDKVGVIYDDDEVESHESIDEKNDQLLNLFQKSSDRVYKILEEQINFNLRQYNDKFWRSVIISGHMLNLLKIIDPKTNQGNLPFNMYKKTNELRIPLNFPKKLLIKAIKILEEENSRINGQEIVWIHKRGQSIHNEIKLYSNAKKQIELTERRNINTGRNKCIY